MAGIELRSIQKIYGQQTVFENLDLQVQDGEFLVIVGPSGCGKSTLLRVIAGLEPIAEGTVRIGGRDVTRAKPGARSISMVFQDYALYPHMTVEQNLTFGIRARGISKPEAQARVERVAAMVEIGDYLRRRPAQLSGGQRQRVALARAMVSEPSAYLMDEPLSNLDAALRVEVRSQLIEFHRVMGSTIVFVTHDQVEAMTMGTRIAIMNKGVIEQIGSPEEIYQHPANVFVARFLGTPPMNLLDGATRSVGSGSEVAVGSLRWTLPGRKLPSKVAVGIRPEGIRVLRHGERTDPGDVTTQVEISSVEYLGHEVLVVFTLGDDRHRVVSRLALTDLEAVRSGGAVAVRWRDLHLFDPATGLVTSGAVTADQDQQRVAEAGDHVGTVGV